MNRLLATTRLDLQLQWRYGFYYAAAVVTLVWLAVLSPLSADLRRYAVPFVIFVDLAMVGFYFIAGMILFEKGERTLQALVVTPLRVSEYLTGKLITLTLMALIVALVVALVTTGAVFNAGWLLLGTALLSVIGLLVGFISVLPYTTISSYILPSQLFLIPLGLPLLAYFDLWGNPLLYLLPTYGSLLLLQGAYTGIAGWQVAYAVVYQAVWIGLLVGWARHRFNRYMVR